MASEVDICNVALAQLGDKAIITSIDPPDSSPQAGHCSRFYPMARDELLQRHTWDFATRVAPLAALATNAVSMWTYTYGLPADMMTPIAVLQENITDEYSVAIPPAFSIPGSQAIGMGVYTPQPYEIQAASDGTQILRTNVENAQLRYQMFVTDTTQFSPLFTAALTWLLGSKVGGALIKGDGGMKAVDRCLKMYEYYFALAASDDANNRNIKPNQQVQWIANR